ncbi:hypothetical protein EUGRSUZ_G02555 [Eucalyptus grandis]|uniref:Uncharacterized protein n=2 Tax=Eucalyptus grandis TaxID=71139 RepID=A0ACC3K641_EUCGR|nr:hypothetical protein EUGRSUZ_G02555 [Eucalyptus grandis]
MECNSASNDFINSLYKLPFNLDNLLMGSAEITKIDRRKLFNLEVYVREHELDFPLIDTEAVTIISVAVA